MPKRSIAALAFFAAFIAGVGTSVFAGDSASFVDLGFSADGTVYMFAQYGIETESRKPWAELFTVDVPKNAFVPGGVKKSVGSSPAEAGQDGSGTFHTLLADNGALAKKYKVDHTREGTPLYVAVENGGGKAGEPIEFRDFDSGSSYKAALVSYVEGCGDSLQSSFFLTVERTAKDGKVKKYTVGAPSRKRPGVSSYAVRRVIAAPKDGSLVFVIEMSKPVRKGVDIRYMVEAFRL